MSPGPGSVPATPDLPHKNQITNAVLKKPQSRCRPQHRLYSHHTGQALLLLTRVISWMTKWTAFLRRSRPGGLLVRISFLFNKGQVETVRAFPTKQTLHVPATHLPATRQEAQRKAFHLRARATPLGGKIVIQTAQNLFKWAGRATARSLLSL